MLFDRIFLKRANKKYITNSRLYSNEKPLNNTILLGDSLSRRRLLVKMTNSSQQKRRVSSKYLKPGNPFDRYELIQRIGGYRIRRESSTLSKNDDDADSKELSLQDVKNETWSPIYRFRTIHLYAIISRLKFFQTLCSVFILPYCYYQYINDEITSNLFFIMSAAAITAPIIMIVFTRYFNKIIGVISINESRNILRIGHLSYWGTRNNKYIPIEDIIPLTESSENPSHSLLKLKRYSSNKNYFLLSMSNTEIIDAKTSKQIFGTNEFFIVRGAKFLEDKKENEKV